jgi:hypothetical protein
MLRNFDSRPGYVGVIFSHISPEYLAKDYRSSRNLWFIKLQPENIAGCMIARVAPNFETPLGQPHNSSGTTAAASLFRCRRTQQVTSSTLE